MSSELRARAVWAELDEDQQVVALNVWDQPNPQAMHELAQLAERTGHHPIDLFLWAVITSDPRRSHVEGQ